MPKEVNYLTDFIAPVTRIIKEYCAKDGCTIESLFANFESYQNIFSELYEKSPEVERLELMRQEDKQILWEKSRVSRFDRLKWCQAIQTWEYLTGK